MSVSGPREGDPGPSGREGSGVAGSGNGPRPAPSFADVVVVEPVHRGDDGRGPFRPREEQQQ